VMVGEIRDIDTAKTAIQASITGHLVLSTFHATNASAAFSRMIDLIGINPIFSTAIRLVVAQRLVRKLDDRTKTSHHPDDATKKWIQTVLADLPSSVEKPDLENMTLYKPGKSADNPFGFNGRIVVMEQLVVGERIQKFIRGDVEDVIATDIEKAAKQEGMVTLLQAGVLKVLAGETTLEEINRAI
jgi:type II secretory ATPase GspE/PulE/Tfp pilus assembly ATPase PilB-like protein